MASRSKDSDLKRRLDELNENAGLLRVPDAVEREDYKTLKAKAEKFQSLFETLTDIKTNGTMDFIRRETGVLQVVDDKMKALFTYKHEVGRNLQDDPLPLKGVCEASLVEVVRFEDPSTHCCTVTAGPSLFLLCKVNRLPPLLILPIISLLFGSTAPATFGPSPTTASE